MQQADMEALGKVFELAVDGSKDADSWNEKFGEFCKKSLQDHSSRLLKCDTDALRMGEKFRAKAALYDIVEQRIDERLTELDAGLLQAVQGLRKAQRQLYDDACAEMLAEVATAQDQKRRREVPSPAADKEADGKRRKEEEEAAAGGEAAEDEAAPAAKGIMAFALARSQQRPPEATQGRGRDDEDEDEDFDVHGSSPLRAGARRRLPSPTGTTRMKAPNSYTVIHLGKREKQNPLVVSTSRPGKDLTLRQLRDIMMSVYVSKQQFDQRCLELREPFETMEQHLYSFLGKRYGLKSVIQEWASAIFRAIQRFAPKECDVAVFGKILQNTMAESFPSVQDTLRSTVQQLLRSQLEERHPRKSQSEIDNLWNARVRNGVPMDECEEVVRYMYNDSDSEEVLSRLRMAQSEAEVEMEPLAPDSVRYKDFTQVLLSFQMNLTEAFLGDFVAIFRQVDIDSDGIVDSAQLEELVRTIGAVDGVENGTPAATLLMEAKVAAASSIRRLKRATFSQCVDLFTGLISGRWAATEQVNQMQMLHLQLHPDTVGLSSPAS